ncbi:hypothetical protein IWW42_001349 [Coemansia sp. RSA 1085]|nr:hypothetical protein BX667DRAFT_496807 [Coemansia mojavensis]KAJ2674847.1 hypothetical protein IWW42_001349 [Coemansia sp. RSA 1085]
MKVQQFLLGASMFNVLVAGEPIYKEIAHSIGYDYVQAVNADEAVSNGIRGIVNALGSLDQFKPIIHPDIVSNLNTIETFGGFVSSLVGWVIKLAVEYFYTSDLLNDTPYVGELIRHADSLIVPELRDEFSSLEAEIASASVASQFY